jgi:hypothetical protein
MAEPVDRVQVIKQESTALGGDDADAVEWGSTPIEPEEDALEAAGYYGQEPGKRDETVLIWREGDKWRAKDPAYGAVDLLASSAGGISAGEHKVLRQLIHFIDDGPAEGFASGAYKEVLPSGSLFPTQLVWWESSSKLKKIVEKIITRTGAGTNLKPTPVKWKVYDTDGTTVLWTISDAIVYSGLVVSTRTRTITAGDA